MKIGGNKDRQICYLVGHAHIDAAWLWTRDETIEVCRDTFTSVLDLMERYPGFCFTQGSAQYYEWMEEHYPALFERIKKRVEEGRWEVVGGMWVEPDCNLPSGESLVRQILYGKRYFQEKFGIDVQVGWLPDTFGFPWTLPQIYKKCGIDYFLTAKLNYETTLPFPYHVFCWESPTGSRILGCQTVGGYANENLDVVIGQLKIVKRYWGLDDLILLYGYGDHGGGPTPEMLDKAVALSKRDDSPCICFSTAKRYFDRLSELTAVGKTFPVVNDELYLKTHRGTYTTQAKMKWSNRKAECLLESAEKFTSFAKRLGGSEYPKEELRGAWRRLLFSQFHDILAGSSIPEVYKDSSKDLKEVFSIAEKALADSLKGIAAKVDTGGTGTSILVFNPLSWRRDGLVELGLDALGGSDSVEILDSEGRVIPSQIVEGKLIFIAEDIPSVGYKEFKAIPREGRQLQTDLMVISDKDEFVLENGLYKVSIDRRSGLLTSVYDKLNAKEVLEGKGNILQIYEDGPSLEDAWNINLGALTELDNAIEVKLTEKGPLRATVQVKHGYEQEGRPDSIFIQDIMLYYRMPWIEFKLQVDWHAAHRLAKVAFPLSFYSEWATYEIPYGSIRRRNPSSPQANPTERVKWEVPGQKWMDYTNESSDYGLSLLNDCKYGFDVKGNVMRMTLLRSPCYPDPLKNPPEVPPLTDQGEYTIKYAIYPHKGDWRRGWTMQKGYEFNYPLLIHIESPHPGELPKSSSFIEVYPGNIILTAVKEAEDSEAMILRLYETAGQDTQAKIVFREPPPEAWETDILENRASELQTGEGIIQIEIGHHEIETIKVFWR